MPHSVEKNITLTFVVERNASLRVELLVAHTDAVIDITCIMRGESAQATINGAYVVRDEHTVRITTMQHHKAAHTKSALVMKGIVDDSARADYSGMIRVEKNARGCVSSQENKNMLLSDNARAVSVPQLEVLTHDVHCFHGSAVGRFDSDHLFYAASRGIDEKHMRRLLVHAFFAGMFESNEITDVLKGL
jgi:Fe-S cluster assembly protein SufD